MSGTALDFLEATDLESEDRALGNEGTSGRTTGCRYSPEEKGRAVRLVWQLRKELGTMHGTVLRVADQIGCGTKSLPTWFKGADIDDGVEPGSPTIEAKRIKELEQENRELRRANDLLKRPRPSSRRVRPPIEVIVAFVEENRDEFGVESSASSCRWLRAPKTPHRSGRARPRPGRRDEIVVRVLLALWITNRKVYGAHKLCEPAQRTGHDVGRDQVARLMRELGIEPVSRRRKKVFTTRADPDATRAPRTW